MDSYSIVDTCFPVLAWYRNSAAQQFNAFLVILLELHLKQSFFGIWTLLLYSHEYMKTSPWHCLAELSKVRIIFIETDEWLQLNVYICCIPENSKRMGKSDNNLRYLKIAKRILSVKINFNLKTTNIPFKLHMTTEDVYISLYFSQLAAINNKTVS